MWARPPWIASNTASFLLSHWCSTRMTSMLDTRKPLLSLGMFQLIWKGAPFSICQMTQFCTTISETYSLTASSLTLKKQSSTSPRYPTETPSVPKCHPIIFTFRTAWLLPSSHIL